MYRFKYVHNIPGRTKRMLSGHLVHDNTFHNIAAVNKLYNTDMFITECFYFIGIFLDIFCYLSFAFFTTYVQENYIY